jgi:hypothetical protein
MREQYETVLGGEFLASHYPEAAQVAYRVYVEMSSGCSTPVTKAKMAAALRDAKARGYEDLALQALLSRRRQRLNTATVLQRKWQSKISRRPGRQRHHDSAEIRERYVRGES